MSREHKFDLAEIMAGLEELKTTHHIHDAKVEIDLQDRLIISGVSVDGDYVSITFFNRSVAKIAEITKSTRFVPKRKVI